MSNLEFQSDDKYSQELYELEEDAGINLAVNPAAYKKIKQKIKIKTNSNRSEELKENN